jgi:hypothetical protein
MEFAASTDRGVLLVEEMGRKSGHHQV